MKPGRRLHWPLLLLWALVVGVPAPSRADGEVGAVVAQLRVEDDADDLQGLLARGGLLFDYASPYEYAGLALQNLHYAQDGWSEDVVGLVGLYRKQRRVTLEGLRAEGGLAVVGGTLRPIGDATWTLRPRASTGVELIAAADVVGTREAIERSITYGLAAASVEQQFGARWTAIGLLGWQPFTDGNARALLRARLIYSLLPDQGVSAQLRWRQYSSREEDVGGAYFNPGRYRNWDAGLAWRHRVHGWRLSGLAGLGQERIDDQSWQSTGVAELRAEATLTGGSILDVGLTYSNSAGFATAPDYWYSALNVVVTFPLR